MSAPLIVMGTRKDGSSVAHHYAANTDLERLVQGRYKAGWRSLRVFRAGDPDRTAIAMICANDEGKRVWWVES